MDYKKDFQDYINKSLETFLNAFELKGTPEDIKSFAVMLNVDASFQKPWEVFWESIVELTDKQRKHLQNEYKRFKKTEKEILKEDKKQRKLFFNK